VRASIRAIAAGGEGVGRLEDGCTVFVHRTAPGDEADVELTHRARRWARGRLVRLLRPGEGRREAPCPFYADCGGCTLQHLAEEAQRAARAAIVAEALTRLGGVALAAPPDVIPSPRPWRYRNRMSFLARRAGGGAVLAGLHALGEPYRLVEVDERCLLPEEPVAAAWGRLRRALTADAALLPPGEEVRLSVRGTAAGEVLLLVEGGPAWWDASPLGRASGPWAGVWQRGGEGRVRRLEGGEVEDDLAAETVAVAADAFLQVNRGAAARLYEEVARQVGEVRGQRVVDAYAGVGVLARRLARAGARVTAIEANPRAAAQARRAGGFEVLTGAAERHLPRALPAEVVILNPPRSGCTPAVLEALRRRPPRRVVYVSCDPATLARDLRRLGEAFTVQGVACVDLFPQTAHVETVATLRATSPMARRSSAPLPPHPPAPAPGRPFSGQ